MKNHLYNETSPYLLQHVENPVDWYPWSEEAFQKAKAEDKPIFLSIGYSTCHWCHVMAHESFENETIAELLNRYFVSIKVDKEERPDIDSIYMAACQAFTGRGGWPTSVFMTADQKPFFAGTYFPPTTRGPMIGMRQLLTAIHDKWVNDRHLLLKQGEEMVNYLKGAEEGAPASEEEHTGEELPDRAIALYKQIYDSKNGGFGQAPKFPTPHNLIFLLDCCEKRGDTLCRQMAEHTLLQMYRGGLFDHIGFGFARYSTDEKFLAPHFEKMLYDNALLILAYCKAYSVTKKERYLEIAEKTADFILREMTAPEGGFYSAQDADSEGEEGKFYLFSREEILELLGKTDGETFCSCYDITPEGNFEGKNIPNLLKASGGEDTCAPFLKKLRDYRKGRYSLHLDDKILTAWNGLMITAMSTLYQVSGREEYRKAAEKAYAFLKEYLSNGTVLYVSYRDLKQGVRGFLNEYASCLYAQLALYSATLEEDYLEQAKELYGKIEQEFADRDKGGFYLYGKENEALILQPKETYDGAIPSGNSLMAWNLLRLWEITDEEVYEKALDRQIRFLGAAAAGYPIGNAMFLQTLLERECPTAKVTVVLAPGEDEKKLPLSVTPDTTVVVRKEATAEYPLKDGKTTFYVCKGHSCLAPVHDLKEYFGDL